MEDLLECLHEGRIESTVETARLLVSTADTLEDLRISPSENLRYSDVINGLYDAYGELLVDKLFKCAFIDGIPIGIER